MELTPYVWDPYGPSVPQGPTLMDRLRALAASAELAPPVRP